MQIATHFPAELKRTLELPEVASLLRIMLLKLDKPSATALWLSLQFSHEQWDSMAKALNELLPKGEKFKGGVIPCTTTMILWCAPIHATAGV